MDKYIFTSDYTGKVYYTSGGRPAQIPVEFKKGMIVDGKTYTRGVNAGINAAFSATETVVDIETQYGVCTIVTSNSIGRMISPIKKVGAENSTQQPLAVSKENHIDTIEDKIYSAVGIKYSGSGWGIFSSSRTKGRLLIILLAISGYIAYKKYSK